MVQQPAVQRFRKDDASANGTEIAFARSKRPLVDHFEPIAWMDERRCAVWRPFPARRPHPGPQKSVSVCGSIRLGGVRPHQIQEQPLLFREVTAATTIGDADDSRWMQLESEGNLPIHTDRLEHFAVQRATPELTKCDEIRESKCSEVARMSVMSGNRMFKRVPSEGGPTVDRDSRIGKSVYHVHSRIDFRE